MTLSTIGVAPGSAAGAYARTAAGQAAVPASGGFGAALSRAMEGVVDAGTSADSAAIRAMSGQGNVTEVVTAVSRAELALQTAVAVRDKVVQAYQDVMRMPI